VDDEERKHQRVTTYANAASRTFAGEGTYRGLKIHALMGLHQYAAACLRSFVPPPANILEVGSGSGALAARLSDLGYRVTACDLVAENFRLHGETPFVRLDLDADFASQLAERFDAIAAVEIIEHLENPWHFLRECASLLKEKGNLLVTTPNLDNPVSKALFVRFGTHLWFDDRAYQRDGHITPLSLWQLQKCARAAGLEVVSTTTFGAPYAQASNWLKLRLFARILGAVMTTSVNLQGEILVVVLRKPTGIGS
jgi:2-polyprenyl-3-methyl-5-hydroxy-6-metoxy-1,4-benzoquinol methylase